MPPMIPHDSPLRQRISPPSPLDVLDETHRRALNRAVGNVLRTEVAELTYAQILDGLPTVKSVTDSYPYLKDHPVYTINHVDICPGFVELARDHRSVFTMHNMDFNTKTLEKFQAASEPREFHLRLIELVVSACHQIGAYLFKLDGGVHKHEFYQEWRNKVLEEKRNGVEARKYYIPSPIAFSHRSYRAFDQYPMGLADVAGYWAESKIFGGVVVFDRGETETECKSMWIHGDLVKGPQTLYPPTEEQFDDLVKFLTSVPNEDSKCPFPIHGTRVNRPRWDAYDAFAHHHIFRDKYERKLPSKSPRRGCVQNTIDWPELEDQRILMLANFATPEGGSYSSEEEVAAAEKGISNITRSSPLWRLAGNSPTPR